MKQERQNKRWRVVADFRLQGLLCLRVAVYWLVCQMVMAGTVFGFSCLEAAGSDANGSVSRFIVPALFASALVLPIALFDMLVFSNRIAGPLLNFRRKFTELVENGISDQLDFRAGDYFPDLVDNFNKLQKKYDQGCHRPSSSVQVDAVAPSCEPSTVG